MKKGYYLIHILVLATAISFSSCCTQHHYVAIKSKLIPVDGQWDQPSDGIPEKIVEEYKITIDSIMSPVVGKSSVDLVVNRPESPLSNLIADVLRNSTIPYTGQPADMALINIGGLRTTLNKGDITYGNIYEILPFENALCILYLKGNDLKELMENIVSVGGEGVSNVKLIADKDKNILTALIGGKPIEEEQTYAVATLDYLAEGNDKMSALLKAEKKICHPEATIRSIFLNCVSDLARDGKEVSSTVDGRIELNQ